VIHIDIYVCMYLLILLQRDKLIGFKCRFLLHVSHDEHDSIYSVSHRKPGITEIAISS